MNLHRRRLMIATATAATLGTIPADGQTISEGGTKTATEPTSRKIGLIGGLAYRSGLFYYDQIFQRYEQANRPLNLILRHADVKKVIALIGANDRSGLGEYLADLSNELFAAGVDVVGVAAVAPHLAFAEMSQAARGPIVNILDTVAPSLEASGTNRIAIFGLRSVMTTNLYGTVPKEEAAILPRAVVDEVHSMYVAISLEGKVGTQPEYDRLNAIALNLMEKKGVQRVILAGADLSSFYSERKPNYPHVDMALLHVNQIIGS